MMRLNLTNIKENAQDFYKNKIQGQGLLNQETKDLIDRKLFLPFFREYDGTQSAFFPENLTKAFNNLSAGLSPLDLPNIKSSEILGAKTYYHDRANHYLEESLNNYESLFHVNDEKYKAVLSNPEYLDTLVAIINSPSSKVAHRVKSLAIDIVLNSVLESAASMLKLIGKGENLTYQGTNVYFLSLNQILENILKNQAYKKTIKFSKAAESITKIKQELVSKDNKTNFPRELSETSEKYINKIIKKFELDDNPLRDNFKKMVNIAKMPVLGTLTTASLITNPAQSISDSSLSSYYRALCPTQLPLAEQIEDSRVLSNYPAYFDDNYFTPKEQIQKIADFFGDDVYTNDMLVFLENISQNPENEVQERKADIILSLITKLLNENLNHEYYRGHSVQKAQELADEDFTNIIRDINELSKDNGFFEEGSRSEKIQKLKNKIRVNLNSEQNHDNFYIHYNHFFDLKKFIYEFIPYSEIESGDIADIIRKDIYDYKNGSNIDLDSLKSDLSDLEDFVENYRESKEGFQTLVDLHNTAKKIFLEKKITEENKQILIAIRDYVSSKAKADESKVTLYDFITNNNSSIEYISLFNNFEGVEDSKLLASLEDIYSLMPDIETAKDYSQRLVSTRSQQSFKELRAYLSDTYSVDLKDNLSFVRFLDEFDRLEAKQRQVWTNLGDLNETESIYDMSSSHDESGCFYAKDIWALDIKVPKTATREFYNKTMGEIQEKLDIYNSEMEKRYGAQAPQFELLFETHEDPNVYLMRITLSRN